MFKKGQFIKNIGTQNVYKVIGITNDLGNNRVYILRPKGKRKDDEDFEERVDYVNKEYILDKKHSMKEMMDIHEFLLKGMGVI